MVEDRRFEKMTSFRFVVVVFNLIGIARGQGLTIDNQLVIVANDCYTRVAIGSKLAPKDVTSRSEAATVTECEDECSRKRNSCAIFSLGISPKGNGTCLLGTRAPDPENLVKDSDYDVYIRQQSTPDCLPDRLYQLGSGKKPASKLNESGKHQSSFGSGYDVPRPGGFLTPRPQGNRGSEIGHKVFSAPIGTSYGTAVNDHRDHDTGVRYESGRPVGGEVNRPHVDRRPSNNRRPIHDNLIPGPGGFGTISIGRPVVAVGPGPKPSDNQNHPEDETPKPFHPENPNAAKPSIPHNYPNYQVTELNGEFQAGYGGGQSHPYLAFDEDNPNPPNIYNTKIPHLPHGYGTQNSRPFANDRFHNRYPGDSQFGPMDTFDAGNSFEDRYPHGATDEYGTTIYETPNSCYRKLFTGKRIAEIHVRRVVNCDHIEQCSRECDLEKDFFCEGFNFRFPGSHDSRRRNGFCELTSIPMSQMDIVHDFTQEPRCDYYERDLDCVQKRPSSSGGSLYPQTGWINVRGDAYRPGPGDDRGPYLPDRRPLEPSRPDRRPYLPDRHHVDEHRRPLRPDRRRPYIDVPRPIDDPEPRPQVDGYFHGRPNDEDRQGHDRFQPSYWRPDDRRPIGPIRIRPIEDDIRYDHFRPERPSTDIRYRPQHDVGTNEIEPYRPDRRKEVPKGWGDKYEGVYGSSFGYNTNYVDKYDVPKQNPFSNQNKRPIEINGIYGDTYNYGGAFGYGDNYIPADRDIIYGGTGYMQECSIRSGAGFKLRRDVVRKSYLTPNLDHCENLCALEKDYPCRTFSYRYILAASAPTDNCLLSEISYRELDFYNDLEPDRDFDIYSMTGNAKSCEKERSPGLRPSEDCFWRVRSGCGIPVDMTRKVLVVEGLGECEVACIASREYTCRSFVYRYGSSNDGAPNCFLSDWPFHEIDPLSLTDLEDAELYQRGSFGRGCEPYPLPPLNHYRRRPKPDTRPPKKDEACYVEYQKPCRLTPYAVMITTTAIDEYECRQRCSEMRKRDPLPCMSFSFSIGVTKGEDNCFMSDIPRRDLRPGVDFTYDDGHILFAWKEFEPQCDAGPLYGYSVGIVLDDEDDFQYNIPPHGYEDQDRPGGYLDRPASNFDPNSGPYHSHFRPSDSGVIGYSDTYGHKDSGYKGSRRPGWTSGSYPTLDPAGHRPERPHDGGYSGLNSGGHWTSYGIGYRPNARPAEDVGYHNSRPLSPDRPDSIVPSYGSSGRRPGGSFDIYDDNDEGLFSGYDARFGHHNSNRHRDSSYWYGESTFQHFTVNGYPCKRGTRCERNKVAGFWSCEPEGGEYGMWDYCCEPNHHCGYSQGYHYPWCYVGPATDQWRPCSEQYYPYLPSPRPIRPTTDHYNYQDSYSEVPRPGLLGRHWPVAYLHREAPPNATDSVAAADSRTNRELNTSDSFNKSDRIPKTSNDLRSNDGTNDNISTDGRSQRDRIVKPTTENLETRLNLRHVDAKTKSINRRGQIERISRLTVARNNTPRVSHLRSATSNIEKFSEDDRTKNFNETNDSQYHTRFVEIPTISANTTKSQIPEDYFEVVDIN